MLELERAIAAIRRDEYVEEIGEDLVLGYNWFVLGGFGENATLVSDLMSAKEHCAVITFTHTHGIKLDSINDEVMEGHPLYGSGLGVCGL